MSNSIAITQEYTIITPQQILSCCKHHTKLKKATGISFTQKQNEVSICFNGGRLTLLSSQILKLLSNYKK